MDAQRGKLHPNVDWVEHLSPKTFGKHKMLLLRFWEMIFGPFNCQTVRRSLPNYLERVLLLTSIAI